MKILYDHQIFTLQYYGGISRYFCELMNQFSIDPSIDFTIALRYSQNDNLHHFYQLDKHWSAKNTFFSNSHIFSSLQKKIHVNILNHVFDNQREAERLLKGQNYDLFHPTYYNPYFLKHLKNRPYTLTIFDMIHEIFPDFFKKDDSTRIWKKNLAENAHTIITISSNTKNDIIKYLGINPEDIHVLYLGCSFNGSKQTENDSKIIQNEFQENFLLFVGNRLYYKNFIFLINSISTILKQRKELHLICIGGGTFSDFEKKMMTKLEISDKVHYIPANDVTLRYFYENARAFIFPSLYEGFGLPVLEAFYCRCPVLLSNTSSLPEIGGDAAIYFDPHDQISLINAVENLLSDENLRQQLIEKGVQRMKLFSWQKTASSTKKLYEKLIT